MKTLLLVGGLFSAFVLLPGDGLAQIGGPPGPGEWHQVICSVPIEKTCLETSPIPGGCASESSQFVCVDIPVPGEIGVVIKGCQQDKGIVANPNDPDPNYLYQVKREAASGEAGFSTWRYFRDEEKEHCGLIEICECEPPVQPRTGKCRHKQVDSVYRPVQWEHDPNAAGCVGF